MGFFFHATKGAPRPKSGGGKQSRVIPIGTLQELGCRACPRDKDEERLESPKMRPSGVKNPSVYLLGTAPSEEDDRDNMHWSDLAGEAIYSAFGKNFMETEVRSNYITQCRGDQTEVERACCRSRVVADIEACKPLIIVTVGDQPFYWATGVEGGGVLRHRGTLFVAKIGNHTCYVLPIIYPNFIHKKKKKSFKKSEWELVFEADIRYAKRLSQDRDIKPAFVYEAPYDTGVEIITGHEPGDMQRLEQALNKLKHAQRSGVDIETNGLRPFYLKDPKMYIVAVGTFEHTVVFPIDHPEGWGTEERQRKARNLLFDYLMWSGRKVAHNLAMEMEWFAYFFSPGILRRTEWDDTMAMAHTLDERSGTKSLEIQTIINFGFNLKKLSNVDPRRILEYPIKKALLYCALDCKWTDMLRRHLEPKVKAENWPEYERKLRTAPTLIQTEAKGVPVDLKEAKRLMDDMESQIDKLEHQIRNTKEVQTYARRFGTFKPSSSDDVLKLMRDVCQRDEIRVEERDGSVRMTTDEEALGKIPAKEVPSAALILEHRAVAKLQGTYIVPVLEKKIVCPDTRIRTKYSSMVAETGRLASEDPNLQNFPKRKYKHVRGMIYAPEGEWIVACDYGQIEFRVVGMASEDRNLVKACWTGYDVHKFWAERMVKLYPEIKDYIVETFHVDWDEKGLKTLRQEAKNGWVFPQLFGSSVRSCAEQLHLPEDIAEDLAEEFWDEFAGVKAWQKKLLADYERNLYVETLGGRKRRGALTLNQVINHPIQGTALDIVLRSMNELSEQADRNDDPYLQPNINVHDDLTFWLPDEGLKPRIDYIAQEMCRPRFDYINVPLVVEASVGSRWHELEEIKVYRSDQLFNTPNPYAS